MKNSEKYLTAWWIVRTSVNRMATGLRLPRSSHGIFSPFYKHTLSKCNIFVLEQAVGPGVLQTFST